MQWPSKLSTEFKGFDLWFKKQGKKKGGGFLSWDQSQTCNETDN